MSPPPAERAPDDRRPDAAIYKLLRAGAALYRAPGGVDWHITGREEALSSEAAESLLADRGLRLRPSGDCLPLRAAESQTWTSSIKRGRFTPMERAEIERLAAGGSTSGQIALRLRRHASTVHYRMVELGLAPVRRRVGAYRRGDSLVRGFSPDEDSFITEMSRLGHNHGAIGRLVGERFGHARTPSTIRLRLFGLAARDEADHG